jgi:hypothetical protein
VRAFHRTARNPEARGYVDVRRDGRPVKAADSEAQPLSEPKGAGEVDARQRYDELIPPVADG